MKVIEDYKIGKTGYTFVKERAKLGPGHIFGLKVVTTLSTGEEFIKESWHPTQQSAHKSAFQKKVVA